MRLASRIFVIAMTLVVGTALAAPGKGQGKGPRPFESFDKDGDNQLSKEEVSAAPQMSTDFEKIDTDKNGSISKEELDAYRSVKHAQKMKGN